MFHNAIILYLNDFINTVFDTIKLKIDSWRLIISIMIQPEVAEIGHRNMASFSNHMYEFSEAYFRKKGDENPGKKARVLDELFHAVSLSYILSGDEEALELMKNEINNWHFARPHLAKKYLYTYK